MPAAAAQAPIELPEPREHGPHVRDRVNAKVGSRPVRGEPVDVDREPGKALVRHREALLGGLRDDGSIRTVRPRDRLRADARQLLVGDGRDHDVTAQLELDRTRTRQHAGGKAALHVVGAAAVHPAVRDATGQRIVHAREPDGVHVRVEHERAAAARTACDADHVRSPRRRLLDRDVEAGLAQPVGDEGRKLDLTRASLDQVGVCRVDADEGRGELGDAIHEVKPLFSRGMRVAAIRPGLWRWTGLHPAWTPESGGWEQEVGSVYYEAADAVVLVDPLVPPEDEERFWRALDRDVERLDRKVVVVVTAPWHARSAETIVARYGATLWAHPAGRSRLGREIDAAVLPTGIEVFEIPPVGEGQVALFLPGHRALVTAEVLAEADGRLRVAPSPQLQDQSRLLSCLRLLLELPIEIVLPAHGEPILEDGRDVVAAAVAHWAPSAA